MTTLRLDWHDYSYFSYEQDLALREVQAVLQPESIEPIDRGLIAQNCLHPDRAVGLVYFGGYQAINGRSSASAMATRQHLLEASANGRSGRQATRYSTHGLHEYKGKFNPQTAQALMSLSGLAPSEAVLDPYFGSGTTLLEAAHRGSVGLGLDVNPLARLIAETKVAALRVHVDRLARSLTHAVDTAQAVTLEISTPRLEYLCKWIPAPLLEEVERLRHVAQGLKEPASSILLLLVSDLLRDYSLQEPQDLRIRRRRSPFPEKPFETRLRERIESTLAAISRTQGALDPGAIGDVRAVTADIGQMREMPREFGDVEVRAVITSPPYAMALPYIDTQRLSLVWLELVKPSELRSLEASLTGSREIGTVDRRETNALVHSDRHGLPQPEIQKCREMIGALSDDDGFRRQAVPALLFRYFQQMMSMFESVRSLVSEEIPFLLVVGHNKTTLGGRQFDIDTPAHLASLAEAAGWRRQEIVPLQAYQRFGLHARNAVAAESLVWLRAE